jgi:hypothetical protein
MKILKSCFKFVLLTRKFKGKNQHYWCTPKLFDGFNYESRGEDNERRMSWGILPGLQHFEGRGTCWSSGMGLRWTTSDSIICANLHKLNNKLVNAKLKHFWCMDEPQANMNSQDSPWPGLGGNHYLPPYSILYA